MEDYKKLQCRLCLSIVSAENCKEIDDVLWNILDVILLKQNFDSRSKHTICDTCLQKAREAFKFKLMCLYTNEIVIPHNNDETKFSVDLKKIYMREKGKGQLTDTLDYEVCRLCMQLILGESMSVHEMKADVIEKYIPEIKFSVITNPIVCGQCFYSFDTHSSFINNCLENIKDASATRSHGSVHWGASKYSYIETEGIDIKCEESEPFNELIKIESAVTKLEDKEISIKTEYDELELEDSNSPSEISSYILENKYRPAMIRTPKKKSIKQKKIIYKNHTPSNRCDRCGREFDKCDCETELEGNLKKLQFRYGSPSELQTYKCDTCEYESENKRNFTSHQLVHKDSTDVQMYKCDTCHFMSKYKCNRDRHQLKHSKHLDMEMYKCDLCKFKNNLKCHHLIHMDASKVQMYICNLCDFKTKFNYKLNDHQFKHAVRSEIHMYKCDLCDFKTKYKNTFNVHQLKHADPSEVQMYKCDLCDFKTKYKHILRIHKTKHLDTSNVRMYKCDLCDYESKYKFRLKFHKLKHTEPPQVQQFKCDSCDFTTKFNFRLTDHQLKHADPSEVPTYKCNLCQFKTKYKYSLRCHQLTHTDPSNVPMYKCDICNYETKLKCNFLRHKRLTHKTSSKTQN